jgi:hypothetical protein
MPANESLDRLNKGSAFHRFNRNADQHLIGIGLLEKRAYKLFPAIRK